MNYIPHYIESNRDAGGVIRIHADACDAIMESFAGKAGAERPTLTVILRNNVTVVLKDETMDSFFSKLAQAGGKRPVVISQAIQDPEPDAE